MLSDEAKSLGFRGQGRLEQHIRVSGQSLGIRVEDSGIRFRIQASASSLKTHVGLADSVGGLTIDRPLLGKI